jgi:hypothetical protein
MKEKATDGVKMDGDNDHSDSTKPKQKITKETLFQDLKVDRPGLYKKFAEMVKEIRFPSLFGIKGVTHPIQFRIYAQHNDMANQIFDKSKEYKNLSHLYRRIFSIGLEWVMIEQQELGIKLNNRFNGVMAELIAEDQKDEEIAEVISRYKNYMTKVVLGAKTQEEVDKIINKLISKFENKADRDHINVLIDNLDDGGEVHRAKDRLRHKFSDRQRMKGWEVVK